MSKIAKSFIEYAENRPDKWDIIDLGNGRTRIRPKINEHINTNFCKKC
jgi:hypothetical protein